MGMKRHEVVEAGVLTAAMLGLCGCATHVAVPYPATPAREALRGGGGEGDKGAED